ncbi:resolvase, N terminal domain protein [Mycobacterium intracellulare 1956]|uniref:Resolvase, N terminal domain protein n=1 Tax=Mycobacterium intracellulare 1956 TaxID=1299331 RepID=X8CNR0_MYCIT|nr:resolvase, N terminal domain protein [Mycobacterium intracellulare 1956]
MSAFSGKPRREYARMLADLASGDRDAVIVYNLDRLHRRRWSWRSSSRCANRSGCAMSRP